MNISKETMQLADRYYEEAKYFISQQNQKRIEGLTGDEQTLCKLAYGTLPSSDIISCDFETIYSFVSHALFLKENSIYCKDIDESMFLHFVFYPRVNSEKLQNCRSFFHSLIKDRISGRNINDDVLQVNVWCGENMTYQAADDRTEGPLTAYYSGLGRCGEESVFAVNAYRSVGIPARQVYCPWWSHCDDNHAWVEVYVQGKWHFLGACEPEPVLDQGWFNLAASRAMLTHFRTFYPEGIDDQKTGNDGIVTMYNTIQHYAENKKVCFRVEKDGNGLSNTEIRLYVMNMNNYRQVGNINTDESGIAEINLGFGSIHTEVIYDGSIVENDFVIGINDVFVIDVKKNSNVDGTYTFIAPETTFKTKKILTTSQKKWKDETVLRCTEIREKRIQSYFKDEYQNSEISEILKLSYGNGEQIYQFYTHIDDKRKGLQILENLNKKDYKDVNCQTLMSYYNNDITCPRILYEVLEDYSTIKPICMKEDRIRFYHTIYLSPLQSYLLQGSDAVGTKTYLKALQLLGFETDDKQSAYGWLELDSNEGVGVSRAESDGYRECQIDEKMEAGHYRLIHTYRLPNGNTKVAVQYFDVTEGEKKKVSVTALSASEDEMLTKVMVDPCLFETKKKYQLEIYCKLKTEPTEHILNELLEEGKLLKNKELQITLLVETSAAASDSKLNEAANKVNGQIICADFTDNEARALFLEPLDLPIVVLRDEKYAYYGHSGYMVSGVKLLNGIFKKLYSVK